MPRAIAFPLMLGLLNDFKSIIGLGAFLVVVLYLAKYEFGYAINIIIVQKNNRNKVQKMLLDMGTSSIWNIVKDHKEYMDGPVFCANSKHFFVGLLQGGIDGERERDRDGSMTLKIFANKRTIDFIRKSQIEGLGDDEYLTSRDGDEIDDHDKKRKEKKKKLVIFSRLGNNYAWLDYTKSYFDCEKRFEVRKGSAQQAIIDDIVLKIQSHREETKAEGDALQSTQTKQTKQRQKQRQRQKRPSNFFIYGSPGSGKSTIALIVANTLNGSLCKDFTPTDPGDNLPNLIQSVEPTESCPLIICNDEADTMIFRAHNSLIPKHKNIPVAVYDKRSMNKFREDIEFYENVYYIETSNVSKDVIDSWDPSYLREGRVDAFYEM